jgi:hypothetical protein
MKPSSLAAMLIDLGLNNPQLVNELQKEHCTESAYRIVLVKDGKEINYVLRGREDLK